MKFLTFTNSISTIRLSEEGILLGNHQHLISPEHIFFYTYKSEQSTYYNLIIQEGQFDFHNLIFYQKNDLVESLQKHPSIYKETFAISMEEVSKESGYLELGENRKVSWGPVKDTGSYDVLYTVPYRKEKIPHYVNLDNISSKSVWVKTEENEIKKSELKLKTVEFEPFGVWNNNQDYWLGHYKQAHLKKDSRFGCQKQFLILVVIVVLWIIYVQVFT